MFVKEQIHTINFRVLYSNSFYRSDSSEAVQLAKQISILWKDKNESKPPQFNPYRHTLSLLSCLLLPTHCRCGGRLLQLIIHYNTQTYTREDSPGQGTAPPQRFLPTQHTTRSTDRHDLCGILTRNPSMRETAYLRLRPRSHRRQSLTFYFSETYLILLPFHSRIWHRSVSRPIN